MSKHVFIWNKLVVFTVTVALISNPAINLSAQNIALDHTALVLPAGDFTPPLLKGIKIDPKDPFKFSFILDTGATRLSQEALKREGEKLTRYFLAALAIPRKDLWVNLSPYENERIIPEALGQTDLGETLLNQDYLLKQLASSLTYPEIESGKNYWDKVFNPARGSSISGKNIPVSTFQKVWIMPDYAKVYSHGSSAYIIESRLKVMMERDYLALKNSGQAVSGDDSKDAAFKAAILPVVDREVNSGKNFASLRQIFYALTLAIWYKENLKQTILNQQYADKGKVNGIDSVDKTIKEKIYNQYLQAFQKGAYNYVKRERTAYKITKRRYFSGGFEVGDKPYMVLTSVKPPENLAQLGALTNLEVGLTGEDAAGEKVGASAMQKEDPLDAIRQALKAGDIAGAKAIYDRNFVEVPGQVNYDAGNARLWIENAEEEERQQQKLVQIEKEHLGRVDAIKTRMAVEGADFLLNPLLDKGEHNSIYTIKSVLRQVTVSPSDISSGRLDNLRVVNEGVIPGETLLSPYTGKAVAAELLIKGNPTPLHLLLFYDAQGQLVRIFVRRHFKYESEGEHAGMDPAGAEFTDIRLREKPGAFSDAEHGLLAAIDGRVRALAQDLPSVTVPVAEKAKDYQVMRPMVHDRFSREHILDILKNSPGLEYLLDFMRESAFYVPADKVFLRFNGHPEVNGFAGAIEVNGIVFTHNKTFGVLDFSHEVTHAVYEYLYNVLEIGRQRAHQANDLLYERKLYYALVDYFKKSHMHFTLRHTENYRYIYDDNGKIRPDQEYGAVTEAFAHTMEAILSLSGYGALRVPARFADVQFLVKMGLLPEYFCPAGFVPDSGTSDSSNISQQSYYFPLVAYLAAHGRRITAKKIFMQSVRGSRSDAAKGLAVLAKLGDPAAYDYFAAFVLEQEYFTDAKNPIMHSSGMKEDLFAIYQQCRQLSLPERAQQAWQLLEAEAAKAPLSFIELLTPELEPEVAVQVVQLFVAHSDSAQRARVRERFAHLQIGDMLEPKGLADYYKRVLGALDAVPAAPASGIKAQADDKTGGVNMTKDDFVKFSGTKTVVLANGTQPKTATIVRLFPVVLKTTPVESIKVWLQY